MTRGKSVFAVNVSIFKFDYCFHSPAIQRSQMAEVHCKNELINTDYTYLMVHTLHIKPLSKVIILTMNKAISNRIFCTPPPHLLALSIIITIM